MHLLALLLLLAQDGKEGRAVNGEVAGVEGRTLVLSIKKDGGLVVKMALPVAEDAAIVIDGEKAKLSDLKPGRAVRVLVRGDAVQRIEAAAPREGTPVAGEVVRLEERTLVLSVKREDQKPVEQSLKVDKEAAILVDGEKGRLEDLKPGTAVRVLVRREVAVRIEASRKREEAKPAEKPKAPEAKVPEKPKPAEKPKAPEVKAPEKPAEKPAEKPKPAEPPKPVEPPKPPEKPKAVEPPKPPPPPPEPPRPFPVDESIVPKSEKYPDVGGRVLSVFEDGPTILVTVRQNGEEVPFYMPKDAAVTYVALEKPDQRPTVGYLAYAWLKPGSKDTASLVRFGRPR